MSTGGASETTARRVHPAKEVVPDMYPNAPTARTQAPINAAFTKSIRMFRVYGPGSATAVLVCTSFGLGSRRGERACGWGKGADTWGRG